MELKKLNDQELLNRTKQLVQIERKVLTRILHHLLEVYRRKLFCDLGYKSLFEYAVKELSYSEGQAGRRIQAMRALKEFPQIEKKIEDGKLSLSNISQAQSYFREAQKTQSEKEMTSEEKLKIFASLENKSAREGQKELLKLQPDQPLPKERERMISETHTEVSFILTEDVRNQLEEVRSLIGLKGSSMSLAELVEEMAALSIQSLKEKRFGKKRARKPSEQNLKPTAQDNHKRTITPTPEELLTSKDSARWPNPSTLQPESSSAIEIKPAPQRTSKDSLKPSTGAGSSKSPRYISKAIRYQIWQRDQGRCSHCGSRQNLNDDHIKPVALGGGSDTPNLRLLCFNCNQRQAIKTFGDQVTKHYQQEFF